MNNQVIFLPAAPGIGSAVMMQPQPFILMNPTEMPRISPPPLIAAHNVHTGGGGNYILVSPSQTAPNSLFQVMPSSGVAVSPSSKIGNYLPYCMCVVIGSEACCIKISCAESCISCRSIQSNPHYTC